MADESIKPMSPVPRAPDALKKKKSSEADKKKRDGSRPDRQQGEPQKGRIDTYA